MPRRDQLARYRGGQQSSSSRTSSGMSVRGSLCARPRDISSAWSWTSEARNIGSRPHRGRLDLGSVDAANASRRAHSWSPGPAAVETRRNLSGPVGEVGTDERWRLRQGLLVPRSPIHLAPGGERPVSSASSCSVGSSICQGMPLTESRCPRLSGRDRPVPAGVRRALRARPPHPCARPAGSGPRAPPHQPRASPRARGPCPWPG